MRTHLSLGRKCVENPCSPCGRVVREVRRWKSRHAQLPGRAKLMVVVRGRSRGSSSSTTTTRRNNKRGSKQHDQEEA